MALASFKIYLKGNKYYEKKIEENIICHSGYVGGNDGYTVQ